MWGEPELPPWRAKGWDPDGRLWGRGLRQATVLLLSTAREPCTIRQLVIALEDRGYATVAQPAHKAVSDALRYEVVRGRATRVRRGVYFCRPLPYSTRRRYQHLLRTGGLLPKADVRKIFNELRRMPGGAGRGR